MGMMAAGQDAMNSASIRNQGGQAGFLGGPGAIDGTTQSVWNLADPFNTTGRASSGHVLSNILDPGNIFGQNQAANPLNGARGGQTTMPNLGAASMIPAMPGGSFGMSSQGTDPFNAMANQSAGQLFTPGQAQPAFQGGSKPGMTMSSPSPVNFMTSGMGAIGRPTQPYRGNLKAY